MSGRSVRASVSSTGLVFTLLAAGGCGTSGLDVHYPAAGAHAAGLASAAPRRIQLNPVTDRRAERRRIGAGEKNRDIVTSRPVVEIVHDALVVELSKNGYAIVSDGRDAAIATDVDEFWLDVVTGYSKIQYVGKVAIALAVTDGRTGAVLLTRRYLGINRREVEKTSTDVAREVMETALVRTLHDLATDGDLAAAFARAGPPASLSPQGTRASRPREDRQPTGAGPPALR